MYIEWAIYQLKLETSVISNLAILMSFYSVTILIVIISTERNETIYSSVMLRFIANLFPKQTQLAIGTSQ